MNTVTMSAKGSQHSLPSTRCEFSRPRIASNAVTVINGIGNSAMNAGMLNQRSRTVGLTQGVMMEISPMPITTPGHMRLAQCTARRCSSFSVFRISQHAPSST